MLLTNPVRKIKLLAIIFHQPKSNLARIRAENTSSSTSTFIGLNQFYIYHFIYDSL